MERSEPSLVPEWLRINGNGGLSHHFASSQADGPLLALPNRNKVSKSSSNSDARYSSFRKSSGCNGPSNKHDKNPYSRSYSWSNRNKHSNDRENFSASDSWDCDYSDPLTSSTRGRLEKSALGRSQSLCSSRAAEISQRKAGSRNRSQDINGYGKGAVSVASVSTDTPKVPFERDFPLLGSDERPKSAELVRVQSPRLVKDVKKLSIGSSSLIGKEGWTSELAEVPEGVAGNINVESSHGLRQPINVADGVPAPASVSMSSAAASNSFNMVEALVNPPAQSNIIPQQSVLMQRSDELPSVGAKKLIPMTPSVPKTMVLNPSDKLKPKTAARSNDRLVGHKNGLLQMPSLQLGSQGVRGGSALADGSKLSSGMLLLKPGRAPPVLKDAAIQTTKTTCVVANVQSSGLHSLASVPFKTSNNMKHFNGERKASDHNSKSVPLDKQSVAQLQNRSRNEFFEVLRNKSMCVSCTTADSGSAILYDTHGSGERKLVASAAECTTENGGEVKYNGDTFNLTESYSDRRESALSHFEVLHPDEEELDFLRALGWEDDAGDDEGLTQEEINAFVEKYMKNKPDSKLLRGLQLKMTVGSDSQGLCSTDVSSELSTRGASI